MDSETIEKIIQDIFKVSSEMGSIGSGEKRSFDFTFKKLVEEHGELSSEIILSVEDNSPGDDGVIGEGIDCIITAIDILWLFGSANKWADEKTIEATLGVEKSLSALSLFEETKNSDKDSIEILQSIILLKSNSILSELSVALQIYAGQTYKTAQSCGYTNIGEMITKIIRKYIINKIAIIMIDSNLPETSYKPIKDYAYFLCSKKLEKWKEKAKKED